MKMVKEHGGHSIAVYGEESKRPMAQRLIDEHRVNFACHANYRKGGEIHTVVTKILDKIKADYDIDSLAMYHKKSF